MCGLSLALTALSLFLLMLNLDTYIFYNWLERTLVAVGYSAVRAIIGSRTREKPIGWLFWAIGNSYAE